MEEFKGRDVAFVSDWLTKKVFKRSLLKTGGAYDDCSLVDMTDKSDDRVGHLNTILARRGGNSKDPIFKSSNARAGGMLKFRVDRCIIVYYSSTSLISLS